MSNTHKSRCLNKYLLLVLMCVAFLFLPGLPTAAGDQSSHPGLPLESPAFGHAPRIVLQIIDGNLHKWVEYEDYQNQQLSVLLLKPEQKTLSAMEMEELFAASQQWEEQQRLRLTSLAASQVISNSLVDNRSAIENRLSVNYPYNTIGMLTVQFGSQFIRGTGFLISPHTVLTNAHNLYAPALGGWHMGARFAPGQYETSWPESRQPFSTREPVKAEVNQAFLRSENTNDRENQVRYDYGALFFEQPFAGIDTFMPLQFNQVPTSIAVIGYPGFVRGSPSQGQWLATGAVLSRNDYCLFYDALTSGGSSGSPVFSYDPAAGTYRVVAIHSFTYENKPVSGGPHLNSLNLDQIESWMRWTPVGNADQTAVRLALDKTSLTLDVGAIEMLMVSIIPAALSTMPLTWSSSDNTVATVSGSGLVTAHGSGRATITVRTADSAAMATSEVTVRRATGNGHPASSAAKGDLNGDSLVNIHDVTLVKRHVLQLQIVPSTLVDRADVNEDRLVDVRDVNLVMRFALGLISGF